MKKWLKIVVTSLILLCAWGVSWVFAQSGTERPFITKWKGEANKALKIPIVGSYQIVIKDGSGNEKVNMTAIVADADHPFVFVPTVNGTYTVEAGPEGVKYMQTWTDGGASIDDLSSLLEVVQFGTVKWESMKNMFKKCKNITFAAGIDTPDLSKVTDMSNMFASCTSFNQPLNDWDVSKVTDLSYMFSECTSFNQPLNNWNVGNAADVSWMFASCTSFNQPLGNWNVSNMMGLFASCTSFNQPLGNWNVSNVTDMSNMFSHCSSFNQPLGNWNVRNVTDMSNMFASCTSFNQPLNDWKVSNVTDMSSMFWGCSSFNQPLDKWDVSKVTNMNNMFTHCTVFNQPLNDWKVNEVTDMSLMFLECSSFNQPLDKWDVSKVTSMSYMFSYCSAFNHPLNDWKVNNVTDIAGMFSHCSTFNQPLGKWKVNNVTSMREMFKGCSSFNRPLDKWDVSNVTDMDVMFKGCSSFNQPLGSWKIKTVVGGLNETAMSPSNYSKTLVGWAGQADITSNLKFGENVKGLVYNDQGQAARGTLVGKGWTFEGDIHQASSIAITPSSLPLALNKEVTLVLERWGIEETEEVTLSTDKVGIISYGLTADKKGVHIKGLMEGKCKLTATIAAKPGVHNAYTSTCEIEVYVPIEHFTITPASKTMTVGQKFTLTANFFPENATKREVRWTSYNTMSATVNNGEVTAHRADINTIEAEINEYGRIFKGTCKVTVVDAIPPVTSITIPEKQTITIGTKVPLTATVKPDDAEQGLVWSTSDPAVATVNNGFVWGKKKGKCTITVKSLDPTCTIVKQCEITVVVPSFPVTLTQPDNGRIAIEGHGTETSITVEQGTTLTVTVTENEGYKLKSLTAGDEDITTTKTFIVKAATEVKAVFEQLTFQITPNVTGEGCSLTFKNAATNATITDLGAVPYGTKVKVVSVPKEGWELKELTANGKDIFATKEFTIKEATTVKAVFKKILPKFSVTLAAAEHGRIAIEGHGTETTLSIEQGTTLTVTATPDEGYKLKSLTAGDEDITNSKQFTVTAATEVKAVFEQLTFQITPDVTGQGCNLMFMNAATGMPIVYISAVPYGMKVKVVPVPKEGWELKELSANGKDIFAAKEFTIKEATTVKAVFKKILPKFTVTLAAAEHGKIAIEGHGTETTLTVEQGTTLTVTATPDEGYKLKSLTAGDENITTTKTFIVKAATEVKAVFEKETFAVTTSVNNEAWGSIALAGAADLTAVAYGTELTVTVTEKEGYKLKSLTAGDKDITTSLKFTVKAATTVTAVFEKKDNNTPPQPETFVVTLAPTENGTLAIKGYTTETLKSVAKDTELTVIATPNDGYKLKTLTAGDEDITTTKTFIVKAATTVTAVFEKKDNNTPPQPETFVVTLAPTENGTLAIKGYTTETLKSVAKDTELTVIATPNDGYKLKTLTAGDEDITNTKQFTVTAATEVKAVFEKETFAVTTSVNNEAWGSIALAGAADLTAVPYGTELTVTVTEKAGYKLKSLTAGEDDITTTKKFTVKAATEVKAVFESKQGGAVEDALLAGIVVAPNPFSAQLRILNPEGVAGRYEVVNAAGVVVRSGALSGSEAIVDTETLPAGIYFVRLEAQNGARKSIAVSK